MALFYGDYFSRDSKSGGAWMGVFVEQSTLRAQHPVIYNVCNYQKPKAGHSALLSWDEVITLFHEFGHTLHGLFASQRMPACREPIRRAILLSFRRRFMNTGPASRRCLPTMRGIIKPGKHAGSAARQHVPRGEV
jgi:hypothetical protein